ncbi:hypothetical protein JOQ06_002536 [Pogonophryne albipinna]|uniref:HAT C-terminal dimerisation domain-containing protein n=1 Tax=Pogonophryne albipinna TaxID=1090488 RepID=A0AAD6FKW8_9TELE|nr:hypothetical protein JOQ06_002536 [Pogonophryne albipinna]
MMNFRTKLSRAGHPEVAINSLKNKRSGQQTPAANIKKPRKGDVHFCPNIPSGETRDGLEVERVALLTEVKKKKKDEAVIKEKMQPLFDVSEINLEFMRLTTVPLTFKFLGELDRLTDDLIRVFHTKGGAAGRKIRAVMAKTDNSEDINVRRDCVLSCLSIYLNEDLDTLVKEYVVTIIQALRRYSIEDFFTKLVYVTDRGSNIVAAPRSVTRLSCAAHILNTVLYSTIGKPSQEDAFGEEVTTLVTGPKSLVTYFKQTSLQNRLKKTLKASVETRWNSVHTMLESISCQYEDVHALLLERGEEGRLNDLSEDTLKAMVMFLQRFKEATKALEASKTPTLHLTAVWLDRLKRHLQPSSTDNLTFSSLKAKLHNEVRRLVNDIKERRASPTQRVATVSSAPPEKRARQSEGLSDVEDSSSSDECTQDEVSAYIDFKSPREENFDVLSWWKEHATRFPNVAHIARLILSIPASSAASERDFSTAGFVVSERRSQLKPGTVDDILFLHSNLKKH